MPYRTSDLLVSSASTITLRTGMSGNSAVLQHFCLRRTDPMSAAYRTVLSRLQYGCSPSIRATLGPLTLCELLESALMKFLRSSTVRFVSTQGATLSGAPGCGQSGQ